MKMQDICNLIAIHDFTDRLINGMDMSLSTAQINLLFKKKQTMSQTIAAAIMEGNFSAEADKSKL